MSLRPCRLWRRSYVLEGIEAEYTSISSRNTFSIRAMGFAIDPSVGDMLSAASCLRLTLLSVKMGSNEDF